MEILHIMLTRRFEIDKHWHLASEFVERLKIDAVFSPVGNCCQMDQSIGRTADRLQHNLRIVESRGGEQFTWQWSTCNRDLRCAFSARFGQASASVIQAIVLAVPMTMQVPTEGARRPFTSAISASSISPARNALHKRRQSVQAPKTSPL